MPLKLYPPRKGKTPFWSVKGTYIGVFVDRSTKTGKRAVAVQILKKWERDIERDCYAVPGEATFASAATAYMNAGGERTYLKKLLEHFGDRPLREIDQVTIDAAAVDIYPMAGAATRNRQVYTPVSSVLRHAGITLSLRRPKGSMGGRQTAWLWPEQAEAIFDEARKINKEFEALLIVLCYTGLRLSEPLHEETTWRIAESFAYVPDSKTGKPVAVHLPPVVVAALANLGEDWKGFRFHKSGHLYEMLKAAAFKAGVNLPPRSAFHIFRHTYATWMRRYGGLDSRGLLGTDRWANEKSVNRYAHVVVSEEAQRADLLPTPKVRKA